MKKINIAIALFTSIFILANCKKEPVVVTPPVVIEELPSGASKIPPYTQRTNGDATAGYDYMVNGNYVSSGIPLDVFKLVYPASSEDLGRTGDNKGIGFGYTASTTSTGVKVVGGNCLSCHAEKINGQLIVGLGNNSTDYSTDQTSQINGSDFAVQLRYGKPSKEWSAYEPFSKSFRLIFPQTVTAVQGVNPADKVFAILAAHRNVADLTWIDPAQYSIPKEVVPTDVPAWWLMKKKNALYYNALGVGDFVRMIMTTSLVSIKDSAEARAIDKRFVDVLAYLKSVKAPKNPNPIDQTLADKGKVIFEKSCAKCHGTYGTNESYPNLLIDVKSIGTDPALVDLYATYPEFNTWFNKSWFSENPSGGQLNPTKGYIAPPLDGIWATAPYFHNGSVPTLEDVLKSSGRPTYWRRNFANTEYDAAKVGWKYENLSKKEDKKTYDTTLLGYGNKGHTYGDGLSDEDRKNLIEYLKTL